MSWLLAFAGFAVLIILHEAGHFVAAKAVGMRVERFFLFFPPKLWSVKRGETEYGIGAIPLGGFVKITGMNPDEELDPEVAPRGYYHQPVWKRIVVIAAGPFVNLVIAFVILFCLAFSARGADRASRSATIERGRPRPTAARSRATGSSRSTASPADAGRRLAGEQLATALDGLRLRRRADATAAGRPRPARSWSSATASEVDLDDDARTTTPSADAVPRSASPSSAADCALDRRRSRAPPERRRRPDVAGDLGRRSAIVARIFDAEQREQISGVVGTLRGDPAGDRVRHPPGAAACSR